MVTSSRSVARLDERFAASIPIRCEAAELRTALIKAEMHEYILKNWRGQGRNQSATKAA
jgi:hypothetical protein